jgi:hypothetical protein
MENLMNVVIESFEKLEMEDKEYVFDLIEETSHRDEER